MGHLFEWATCYEQLTRTPLSEILYPPLQTSSSHAPVPRKRQCPWCPHTLPPCRHTKVVADSPISVLSVPDVLSNLFYSPHPYPYPNLPPTPCIGMPSPARPVRIRCIAPGVSGDHIKRGAISQCTPDARGKPTSRHARATRIKLNSNAPSSVAFQTHMALITQLHDHQRSAVGTDWSL